MLMTARSLPVTGCTDPGGGASTRRPPTDGCSVSVVAPCVPLRRLPADGMWTHVCRRGGGSRRGDLVAWATDRSSSANESTTWVKSRAVAYAPAGSSVSGSGARIVMLTMP
jgi:hypothetical protein